MRRVLTVTGTRSDWGLMAPVREALAVAGGVEQHCILTGMHLLPRFADDRRAVLAEFPGPVHEVPWPSGDGNAAMAAALGACLTGMAGVLGREKPDIVLLQGDRGEMLAAAIAAAHMNIPVAHMSGGDRSGSIDDSIRNAVSTFAHIHLTTCGDSSARLLARGESPGRVLTVGEPGVDLILRADVAGREELEAELGIPPGREVIVVAQHPVTTESSQAAAQMRATLEAVRQLAREADMHAVVTAANNDAGGEAMNAVIAEYAALPRFSIRASLGSRRFLGLLRMAAVLAGNTSSGIWEAPSFGLPVVNVGTRQHGRLRAGNVLDVARHDPAAILDGLRRALGQEFRAQAARARNPYGDGRAGERTARVLAGLKLSDPALVAKWLDDGRDFLDFAR